MCRARWKTDSPNAAIGGPTTITGSGPRCWWTSRRSTRCTVLGREYAAPVGVAPMGIAALTSYRGDVMLARAAAEAGVPCIMSGSSLIRLETVMEAAPGTWFQAYLPGDGAQIAALIDRVAAAGVDTLVLTVDTPVAANRENNVRAGFPRRCGPASAWPGRASRTPAG